MDVCCLVEIFCDPDWYDHLGFQVKCVLGIDWKLILRNGYRLVV